MGHWRQSVLPPTNASLAGGVHRPESISDTLEKMNLGQTVVVDLQGDQNVRTLLACCDPGRDVVGEEAFYAFWEEIRGALEDLEKTFEWRVCNAVQLTVPICISSKL